MSAIILKSQNVPLGPTAHGAASGPSTGKTNFKDFFDQAMKSDHPQNQTNLPRGPVSQRSNKSKPSRKALHAAANAQTPALAPAPKDPGNNVPKPAPPSQPSGKSSSLPDHMQPRGDKASTPAVLAGRQFQKDLAGIESGNSNVPAAKGAPDVPETPNHEIENSSNTGADKSNAKGSVNASPAPKVPLQQPASTDASLILFAENASTGGPDNLPAAPHPVVKPTRTPAEAETLIKSTASAQAPAEGTVQPAPTEPSPSKSPVPAASDEHLEKAVSELANLQLNVISAATPQNGAPLPADPPDGKALEPQKSATQLSPDSTINVHQKQAAVNLQTSGKDSGSSNSAPAQAGDIPLHPSAPAAGSPGEAPNDGKSGHDPSNGHPESPGGTVAAAASAKFSSAANSATTPTAATASTMATPVTLATPAAPAQTGPADAVPTQTTSLPQPAASHVAAAENLSAGIENPGNQAAGMVSSASMLQMHGKTEMRVALQTDALGQVQLHAVLDSGSVGASIAVVNHEAHTLLTNSLPALQQALTDQNVRLDHLSVLNAPMSTGTNTGNSGGGFQSGEQAQPRPNAPQWTLSRPHQASPASPKSTVTEVIRGRLSVHA